MKLSRILFILLVLFTFTAKCGTSIVEDKGDATAMFNQTDILKCEPMTYNTKTAEEKGMYGPDGYSDSYFALQAYYAQSIWKLLEIRCDIGALEASLADSSMKFVPNKTPENVHQAHWSFGCQFLFLRNNIHIERLSEKELLDLEQLAAQKDPSSEETQAFLARTLPLVIAPLADFVQQDPPVDFVYEASGIMAPNNAIVIGLATEPEYDGNGNYVSAEAEAKKYSVLSALVQKTEPLMTQALGIPVRVFLY